MFCKNSQCRMSWLHVVVSLPFFSLHRMADWEDTGTPDVKSAPPILAYEICKNRIPNASLKLTLHLLEKIASFDPANILVRTEKHY